MENFKGKLIQATQLASLPRPIFPPAAQATPSSPWEAVCKIAFSKNVSARNHV